MESRTLGIYITRGNVIRDHNGLIDDKNPINIVFITKRNVLLKKKGKSDIKETEKEQITEKIPTKSTKKIDKDSENSNDIYSLTQIKLQRQVEKLESEIRKNNAQFEKLSESTMPREHGSFIVKNYALGIKDVWMTATERFLMQTATSLGLSKEEMLRHKASVSDLLNDAIKAGAAAAEKNMRKLSQEYAGKKGRGEGRDE